MDEIQKKYLLEGYDLAHKIQFNEKYVMYHNNDMYSLEGNLFKLKRIVLPDLNLSVLPNLDSLIDTRLSEFELRRTKTSDFSNLFKLKNLKKFTIFEGAASNIKGMSNLSNLIELVFHNSKKLDLSEISNLTNLKKLWIGRTYKDLQFLTSINKNLETFSFIARNSVDISPIIYLRNLKSLWIGDSKLLTQDDRQRISNCMPPECRVEFDFNNLDEI